MDRTRLFLSLMIKKASPVEGHPREDKPSVAGVAAGVGAGTTAAGAAGTATSIMRRERREAKIRKSKSFKDFMKNLKSGDVVLSRNLDKRPGFMKMMKNKKLRKEFLDDPSVRYIQEILQLGGGSKHTHAQLVKGKKTLFEIPGEEYGVGNYSARAQLQRGEDLIAYRPAKTDKQGKKAVTRAAKLKGKKYKKNYELAGHGARIFGGAGGKSCDIRKGGRVVCTDVISEAHPKAFKGKRYTSMHDLQKNMGTPVARLSKYKPKLSDKLVYRVAHPVAKNLKWGLLAGGATAAGLKAKSMLSKKKESKKA